MWKHFQQQTLCYGKQENLFCFSRMKLYRKYIRLILKLQHHYCKQNKNNFMLIFAQIMKINILKIKAKTFGLHLERIKKHFLQHFLSGNIVNKFYLQKWNLSRSFTLKQSSDFTIYLYRFEYLSNVCWLHYETYPVSEMVLFVNKTGQKWRQKAGIWTSYRRLPFLWICK